MATLFSDPDANQSVVLNQHSHRRRHEPDENNDAVDLSRHSINGRTLYHQAGAAQTEVLSEEQTRPLRKAGRSGAHRLNGETAPEQTGENFATPVPAFVWELNEKLQQFIDTSLHAAGSLGFAAAGGASLDAAPLTALLEKNRSQLQALGSYARDQQTRAGQMLAQFADRVAVELEQLLVYLYEEGLDLERARKRAG